MSVGAQNMRSGHTKTKVQGIQVVERLKVVMAVAAILVIGSELINIECTINYYKATKEESKTCRISEKVPIPLVS
jgi:hypothetical protein